MSAICNKSPKLVSWAFYALYAFLILQASICLALPKKRLQRCLQPITTKLNSKSCH